MMDKPAIDQELLNLYDGFAHGLITRRQFLDRAGTIAGAGVSVAALLSSLCPDYARAAQVSPDDPAISVSYQAYASPLGAGTMRAYMAVPAELGQAVGGVLVIHENRGLNPYIEDVARRIAVAGFLAFAPDALTPLGGYPGDDDRGRELQSQRDADEMLEDFIAAIHYLQAHEFCSGKVGCIGFCYGGGVSNQLAVRVPELAAAVPFYGRHPAPEDAAAVKAPLLLHHAELDERVNASWPAYQKALDDAGKPYLEFTYPGTNHGFHNDTTPRFDEAAARLAWQRSLEFFRLHLV
jgi:carboxymethylenebutenolidase